MNPSPLSDSQPAAHLAARSAKWTPPAWLLEVVGGDDSVIADLIDVFKSTTEASLQQLQTALAPVDVTRLRSEAHRIKGGAKQVGADALAEICQTLELSCGQAPASRLNELVDRCQKLYSEIESGMTSYSDDHRAVDGGTPL